MLPYYFNYRGKYVHYVKQVTHHKVHGKYSHSSVHFQCGNFGFISKDRPAKLYPQPPRHKGICKACEARYNRLNAQAR